MIASYLTRVHSDKKGSFLSVFLRKPGQSLCQFDQREVELKYNQLKPLSAYPNTRWTQHIYVSDMTFMISLVLDLIFPL